MKTILTIDSTKIGNHLNSQNSPGKVIKTGNREEWSVNRIYDLTGNVYEMTQEEYGTTSYALRGASYKMIGFVSRASDRVYVEKNKVYDDTGFRIGMCINENAECQYI